MATRGLGTLTLDLILRLGGFEQGLDSAARAAQRVTENLRKVGKEGERIAQSVATPIEKYRLQIALLNGLLKDTKITQETYARAVSATTKEYNAANPAMQRYNKLVEDGKKLTASLITPLEAYRAKFKEITQLALTGQITPEVRTAAIAQAKAERDALTGATAKQIEMEREAARVIEANLTPLERYNAAIERATVLLQKELLTQAEFNREQQRLKTILDATNPALHEENRLKAEALKLTQSLMSPLDQYNQELTRINQLRPHISAQDYALAIKNATDALQAANPAQQKFNRLLEEGATMAARLRTPLENYRANVSQIREVASAARTRGVAVGGLSPDEFENRAIAAEKAAFDKANPALQEHNRLLAEGARLTAAMMTPQEQYNAAVANADKLLNTYDATLKRTAIDQTTHSRILAEEKAKLDATNPALQEHARLMAEGARATASVMTPQEQYNAAVQRAATLLNTYDTTLKRTAIDQQTYNRLVKEAGDALNRSVQSQRKSFFALRNDLLGLNGLLIRFTSIYTAIGAVTGIIKIVDQYALLENRLSLVTKGTEDLKNVQEDLFGVAQRTRQEYAGVTDLYIRLAQAGGELGASQRDLIKFTEAVGNAFAVSGTSAERARGVLIQLSQGLASGTFRAEEFNSVLEGSPQMIRVVAQNIERFGGSVGKLRNAVREGEVSSKEFFEALLAGADELQKQVAGMPLTVSQAFTQLRNEFDKAVLGADMGPLVKSVEDLTKLIKDPVFQENLKAFVDLILKLAGTGARILGDLGRVATELAEDYQYARTIWSDVTPFVELEDTLSDVEILQMRLRRQRQLLADVERGGMLALGLDKEEILKDIEDISEELAVLQNQLGTGFGPQRRFVPSREEKVAPITEEDKKTKQERENAQKSILKLIDSMKQQIAVTGLTEEATLRYRIEVGDLSDEFKKAGKGFEKYKAELIAIARELDKFKAGEELKKANEQLEQQLVELEATRIEQEKGTLAAEEYRRTHGELADTIARAQGQADQYGKALRDVASIPPLTPPIESTTPTVLADARTELDAYGKSLKNVAQIQPLDPSGFPIDLSRPRLKEMIGDRIEFETELTITVDSEDLGLAKGRFYNIPSIVNGIKLDAERQLDLILADAKRRLDAGERLPNFPTLEQAEREAPRRSEAIGIEIAKVEELADAYHAVADAAQEIKPPEQWTTSAIVGDVRMDLETVVVSGKRLGDTLKDAAATATQAIDGVKQSVDKLDQTLDRRRVLQIAVTAANVTQQFDEVQQRLLEAMGDSAGAARIAIEKEFQKTIADLQTTLATNPLQIPVELRAKFEADQAKARVLLPAVQQLKEFELARAEAQRITNEIEEIREEYARKEQTIQTRVIAGTLAEIDAKKELIRQHQDEVKALQPLVNEYGDLAKAHPDLKDLARQAQEYDATLQDLATTVDTLAKRLGDAFEASVGDALADVALGVKSLEDAVTDVLDAISESLVRWAAEDIAAGFRTKLGGVFTQIGQAAEGGGGASGIMPGDQPEVPISWGAVFGGWLDELKGLFNDFFGGGAGGTGQLVANMTAAGMAPVTEAATAATALAPATTALTTGATALTTGATTLTTGATTLTTGATTFTTGAATLQTAAGQLIAAAQALTGAAAQLAASRAAGGVAGGLEEIVITAARIAAGGKITGPGTPTSDSIPAWLSTGEFVVKAAAVRQPGVEALLHRINRLPFAGGGRVPELPRLMIAPASDADDEDEQPTLFREFRGLLRRASGGPTDVRSGGQLHGPGTTMSDSMLLLGSTKEFMVRAKAAQQPGALAFLDAFNRGRIDMQAISAGLQSLQHLPRRAAGGTLATVTPPSSGTLKLTLPPMGKVSEQMPPTTIVQQTIQIQAPNGQVSRQTEMQVSAAAARGARTADRRNN